MTLGELGRAAALSTLGVLAVACGTERPAVETIELTGQVRLPAGASGTINLVAFHAWSLEGDLRHPLQRITEWQSNTAEFQRSIEYPLSTGEGLIIYAWLDVNGDGIHCTPELRDEPAGLSDAMIDNGRAHVTVELTTACVGADWFYPAPELGADPRVSKPERSNND